MLKTDLKVGELVEIKNKDLVNNGLRLFIYEIKESGGCVIVQLGMKLNQVSEHDGEYLIMPLGINVPIEWVEKV